LEVTLMDNEENPTMITSNILEKDAKECAKIAIDFAIEQMKETIKLYHNNNLVAMVNGGNTKTIGEIGALKIQSLEKQKEELTKNK
jgi:isocitrate dehydrogenase